jgi:WD40 repeat protein
LIESGDKPRYVRRTEIARGGMGVVLRTWDEHLQRDVALKLSTAAALAGEGSASASRGLLRFLEEAQVMGQIDHPGVVPVHDLGIDSSGRAFFTMSLVEGEDLDRVLAGGSTDWTLRRVARVLVRVCETMAYAHSIGIVHRDLKPANVRVGRFGQVYVMDWGLARVGQDDARVSSTRRDAVRADDALLTQEGAVLGTPAYMPPEQARGALADVDARADVYAIGAILYHALTGAPPYADGAQSGSAAVLAAVLRGAPPHPRDLDPGAPRELAAVCTRAMARDPRARYAGARELGEDLRAWLEGRPVSAAPPGPVARVAKWALRNRTVAGGLALATVGLVAGLAWALRAESLRSADLREHNRSLNGARARAEATADAARLSSALAALELGRVPDAQVLLREIPAERRDWGWRYVTGRLDRSVALLRVPDGAPLCAFGVDPEGRCAVVATADELWISAGPGAELERWPGAPAGVVDVAIRPRHALEVALLCDDGSVRLLRHGAEDSVVLGPAGRRCTMGELVFDPTGKRLFQLAVSGSVRLFPDVDRPGELVNLDHDAAHGCAVCFDDDRMLLAAGSTLRVLDADTGRELERREIGLTNDARLTAVSLARDRELLVFGDSRGFVHVHDRATYAARFRTPAQAPEAVGAVAVDPSGRWVAVHGYGSVVRAIDLDGSGRELLGIGHAGMLRGLGWDTDTGRLWSGAADGTLRAWSVHRPTGARRVRTSFGGVLAASDDGAHVLVAESQGVFVVDPASERLVEQLEDAPDRPEPFAAGWSADDAYAVVAYRGGTVRAWRRSDWRNTRIHTGGHGAAAGMAIDPRRPRVALTQAGPDGLALVCVELAGDAPAERRPIPGRAPGPLAFDGEGARILVGDAAAPRLFLLDAASLEVLIERELEAPATCIALRPGALEFTVGLLSGPILLLDARTLVERTRLNGHAGAVHSVAHDASGRRLVSGGDDRSVRLWDAELGAPQLALTGHDATVFSVALDPHARWLLSSEPLQLLMWSDEAPSVDWDRLADMRARAPRIASELMLAHVTFAGRLRALRELALDPLEERAVQELLVLARPMAKTFVPRARAALGDAGTSDERLRALLEGALDLRGRALELDHALESAAALAARRLGRAPPAELSARVRAAPAEQLLQALDVAR